MTLLTVSMTLLRCFVRISDSPPWSCQGWSWCWKRFLWGTGNLVTGVGGVGGCWGCGEPSDKCCWYIYHQRVLALVPAFISLMAALKTQTADCIRAPSKRGWYWEIHPIKNVNTTHMNRTQTCELNTNIWTQRQHVAEMKRGSWWKNAACACHLVSSHIHCNI